MIFPGNGNNKTSFVLLHRRCNVMSGHRMTFVCDSPFMMNRWQTSRFRGSSDGPRHGCLGPFVLLPLAAVAGLSLSRMCAIQSASFRLGRSSGNLDQVGRVEINQVADLVIRTMLAGVINSGTDFSNQTEAEELHAQDRGQDTQQEKRVAGHIGPGHEFHQDCRHAR